ncbi:hypothetical protein JQC67_04690 [Aurantibacter crassamenti]|uniref:hypothetical protein n=1 Tax=Aurantibacter crassamenti TaxID=1837375 RepID=UPI001939E748|nr:hypothetical protein [Aurantibacter crassamenti]MBM1105434.1 hypothetical protein [Aurantibacter crassamenti]
MKKIHIPLVLILLAFVFACEGKFEPKNPSMAAAELLFPIDKELCLAGTLLESNKINIPFSWSAVDGAIDYRVIAKASGSEDEIVLKVTDTKASLDLEAGTMYTWQVFSNNGKEESKSDTRSFYSQGALVNNYAPFPAIITVTDRGNGNVDIAWQGKDLDDETLTYNVFISNENPPSTYLENTENTEVLNFTVTSGMQYYIVVESKDILGNSTASKKSFVAR